MANTWNEGGIIGVGAGNTKLPKAIFVRGDGVGSPYLPSGAEVPDTWHTIDLSGVNDYGQDMNVPLDAVAVFLQGLLIITHPGDNTLCDLWATFRAPGDDLVSGAYQIQALAPPGVDGVRSPVGLWVPVIDGKFEFFWHHTTAQSLINLSIQAYVRPGGQGGALNDLSDVDTTGATDGQTLSYDSATSIWKPADPAAGTEGKSAYEVAVDNGFVGTEQEWLDLLVGPEGPPGTFPQGPYIITGQE